MDKLGGTPRKWLWYGWWIVLLLVFNHGVIDLFSRFARATPTHWLIHGPKEQGEVVVLGSSSAYRGVDAPLLASQLGLPVVNLGSRGSAYGEQHLVLELYLRQRRPRALLLQVDTWGLSETHSFVHPFHPYRYLPYMHLEPVRRHLAAGYGSLRVSLWRWVPMFCYAEFNTRIGLAQAFQDALLRPPFDPHQFDPSLHTGSSPGGPITYVFSAQRSREFEAILDTATNHGVPVALALSPVHPAYAERQTNPDSLDERYRQAARQRGLAFLQDGPAAAELFADGRHLNWQGAQEWSRQLADFLVRHGVGG